MNQNDLQSHVLELLQKLRGIDPLKELFWSRLNYDRKNQAITRRGWPDSAASLLSEDPTLLATAGKGGDFEQRRLPLQIGLLAEPYGRGISALSTSRARLKDLTGSAVRTCSNQKTPS